MRISPIHLPKLIKLIPVAAAMTLTPAIKAQEPDTFVRSCEINIGEEVKKAAIVVDLNTNILYHYDELGNIIKTYSVASGKKSTPTHTGIRILEEVENYPYKTAYGTKRKRTPNTYGPKVLRLVPIDENGNKKDYDGEFIHGTNEPSSIGKNASKGCIRMLNDDVKELSENVKAGSYVLFTF